MPAASTKPLVSRLLAAAALTWATSTAASPAFPGEIQEQLQMSCAPPCTLCHRDSSGGPGTAIKPFADEMVANGLVAREPDKVRAALDAVEAAGSDSDGDGVGDVAELRDERDPNVKGVGVVCGPTYGCGAHVAPRERVDPVALGAAILAALALLVTARRRA